MVDGGVAKVDRELDGCCRCSGRFRAEDGDLVEYRMR